MARYKSYEDWRNKNTLSPRTQVQQDTQGARLPGQPLDLSQRKMGDTKQPTYTWVDDFFLFDFVGNALWGFGETFVVPTVADVASEISGGPDVSAQFGSQDWKDESWAGKLGYALGTGAGILTGIGAVGKGLQLTSKAAGAGLTGATKGVIKKAAIATADDVAKGAIESVSQKTLKNVVKNTRDLLDESAKEAKSSYNWFNYFKRKEAAINPLSNIGIRNNVTKRVQTDVGEYLTKELGEEGAKKIGKESFEETRDRMTTSILEEATSARHTHFGQSLSHKLLEKGWNRGPAIIAGDMAYEATLLATWDVIAGEAGELAATHYGLNEDQWGYEEWYKRAMHGAVLGTVLAPVRYIKGGKQVALGRSGMVADLKSMGTLLKSRFSKNASKHTDNALLALVNTVAKGADDIGAAFPGTGLTTANLKKMVDKVGSKQTLSINEREMLESGYTFLRKRLPGKDGIIRKLQGEIIRDGYESFARASVGSLVMNARGYKDAYDNGMLFTEEYPWDKFVFDHWIGMLYMKRGKTIDPSPQRLPKFYDQTGLNGNGSEIGKVLEGYKVLGRNEQVNEVYNSYSVGNIEDALVNLQKHQSKQISTEVTETIENSKLEYVDLSKNAEKITEDIANKVSFNERRQPFNLHITGLIGENLKEISRLQKSKDTKDLKKASELSKETKDLQSLLDVASRVKELADKEVIGRELKYMTRGEAIEYIKTFSDFKLKDGTVIDNTNLDVLDTKIEIASIELTKNVEAQGLQYIEQSLKSIGLDSIISGEGSGKLFVHESVKTALKEIETNYAGKRIGESAHSLLETLESANYAESISVGEKGVAYDNQPIDLAKLENLVKVYENSTESMHEIIYNGMQGKQMNSWREAVPGWTKDNANFKDKYIMGQEAIWQPVQALKRLQRSKLMYEVFGKEGGGNVNLQTLYNDIIGELKGKSRFRIVEKVSSSEPNVQASVDPKELQILQRLNKMLNLFDNTGKVGSQDIEVGQFTNIREKLRNAFGDIFENQAEYSAFLNGFVYREYINELTGNPNLTSGLRKVLVSLLNTESLLQIKQGGSLVIRSAKSLKDSITALGLSPSETNELISKITEYEIAVEAPLKQQLKNTKGIIKFQDMPIDLKLPGKSKETLLQEIQSAISEVNAFQVSESTNLNVLTHAMQLKIATVQRQAEELMLTDKVKAQEFQDSILELSNTNENLVSLIDKFRHTNDAIGLRFLMDAHEKLQNIEQRISFNDKSKVRDIKKINDQFKEIITEALNERNTLGKFESFEDVQSHIDERVKNVLDSDRSGRPKKTHTSISPTEYSNKWGVPVDTIDQVLTKPKLLFEQLDRLAGKTSNMFSTALAGIKGFTNKKLLAEGINAVIRGSFTQEQYIDIVMAPYIKGMKPIVEAHITKQTSEGKKVGTYEDFKFDTMFLMQSALGSKKVHLAKYENGLVHIEETSISNWNVGINKLQKSFGLLDAGDLLLLSTDIVSKDIRSTSITGDIMQKLFQQLSVGASIAPSTKEVFTSGEIAFFDKFKRYIAGKGKDAQLELIPVQLDEKTIVLVPQYSMKQIITSWASKDTPLRKELENNLFSTSLESTEIKEIIDNYFTRELKSTVDSKGNYNIPATAENVQRLVMLTRLINALDPPKIAKVMAGNAVLEQTLSDIKYMKLDSPRGGLALNERTLKTSKYFMDRFIDKESPMRKVLDIFNNHIFDKNGKITKHRTLNIFDETGLGANFFGTKVLAKESLMQQIVRNNPSIKPELAEKRVDLILKSYEKIHASAANGEKYLSLPEMASMLMAKGARPDWFVWGDKIDSSGKVVWEKDAKGNFKKDANDRFIPEQTIVGFNVAIKPVEMYKNFNAESGELITHVGKTAYKYHPEFDALMKDSHGNYFLDSIGFESAHKIHNISNGVETRTKGVVLSRNNTETDYQQILFDKGLPGNARTESMEIGREGIMIKSIAGEHDPTISYGFSNLQSNNAVRKLAEITGQNNVINELVNSFSALSENPFAFKNIVSRLKNIEGETGGTINQLVGTEAVLNANGLPIFEFMIPTIEKMVTSDYMGAKNFSSSSVTSGKYNVMTSGSGDYSSPDRRNNIQYSFGGSGMSYGEHSTELSTMYTLTQGKVKRLNPSEGVSLIFKITDSIIKRFGLDKMEHFEPGMDIVVTHDGHILGPHQKLLMQSTTSFDKAAIKKILNFEKSILESYDSLMQMAFETKGISTIGDFAMLLNGTLDNTQWAYGNRNQTYKLMSHRNNPLTKNENAAYGISERIWSFFTKKGRDQKDFSQVHLAKVDLRTPKVGTNDWVITRVEKLLDRRRGPVSEMNFMDLINPQDADFDLDKSASFFGLPAEVLREIHNLSGYNEPARELFTRAFDSVRLDDPVSVTDYSSILKLIERKRGSLMRQVSTLSTLLQYISTKKPLLQPGERYTGNILDNLLGDKYDKNYNLFRFTSEGYEYNVQLKGGLEFADAMTHTKSLIKATIDIYKERGDILDINLSEMAWLDPKNGFLKIHRTKNGKDRIHMDFTELPAETDRSGFSPRSSVQKFLKEILAPMDQIHNLVHMTEHFGDGTSRKIGVFDLLYKYEQNLAKIKFASFKRDQDGFLIKDGKGYQKNRFGGIADGLLSFLGEKHLQGLSQEGLSANPVVQAMVRLRAAKNSLYKTIPAENSIAEIVLGLQTNDAKISDAIKEFIKNEKDLSSLESITYNISKIEDIVQDYKYKGKINTNSAKYWVGELERNQKIRDEVVKQINDPANIKNMFTHKVVRSTQERKAYGNVAVYRVKDGEVNRIDRYKKDEKYTVFEGDVEVQNPARLILGDKITNKTRRAMHDAFARQSRMFSEFELRQITQLFYDQTDGFYKVLRSERRAFQDLSKPLDSRRLSMLGEIDLIVLADYLQKVKGITPGKETGLMQQFLFDMLVPKVSENTYELIDKDTYQLSFDKNTKNERLVFKFLNKAMKGEAENIMSPEVATEMFQKLNDRFKTAFIKQWDNSLTGDIFNFPSTTRKVDQWGFISPLKELPNFVFNTNLNRQAQEIMYQFTMGTYFMNPKQLYQMTYGLSEKNRVGPGQTLPNPIEISSQMSGYWKGASKLSLGKDNAWYEPKKTFRDNSFYDNNKAKLSGTEYLQEIWKTCF